MDGISSLTMEEASNMAQQVERDGEIESFGVLRTD